MLVTFTGVITFPFGLLSAPTTHPAPTLTELIESVSRDLRDPTGVVFDEDTITDLIRLSFIEVGQLRPKEAIVYVLLVEDQHNYEIELEDPWRVDLYDSDGVSTLVRMTSGDADPDGWDFYAGSIRLLSTTTFTADVDADVGDHLRVWGYLPRFPPTDPEDVCDLDGPSEEAVRLHCQLSGFRRLASDRAAFGQWSSQPQNTDVSASQVAGLVDLFARQWEDKRRRIRIIRRV